jgi:hypothetical protein
MNNKLQYWIELNCVKLIYKNCWQSDDTIWDGQINWPKKAWS